MFFRKDHYLDFCESVPMHLTPVFDDLAASDDYLESPAVQEWRTRWSSWYQQNARMLASGNTRPILQVHPSDKEAPFLFEVQKRGILSELANKALIDRNADIGSLVQEAQQQAERVWNESTQL